MAVKYPGTAIIVFAKAPIQGEVKTRLISHIGAGNATLLHSMLAKNTLNTVTNAQLAQVQLWCAPDTKHDFFQKCAASWPITLHQQTGADLGERMYHALSTALSQFEFAIIVGTDCPGIDPDLLQETISYLENGQDAVLSPAQDGGYVLMGLSKISASLFSGISWGEATVYQDTRERLQQLGWKWSHTEELWDVDRPADVTKLLALCQTKTQSYLHTALSPYVSNLTDS